MKMHLPFSPFLCNKQFLRLPIGLVTSLGLSLLLVACVSDRSDRYVESFDSQGTWGVGSSEDVDGEVENGVYDMLVKDNYGLYLASAGEKFSDGVYEVELTQLSGPLNNGFGMLIRFDSGNDAFYAFEISGDGFVWIGYCMDLCNGEAESLVGGGWFRSTAVNRGLMETNKIKIVADGPRMNFFVNGVEVGRTSDDRLQSGDLAVMVETLGRPDVRVAFDNFIVIPPGE